MRDRRTANRKRSRTKGFSLVEMLVSLLILALMAVMVSTCVAASVQVYKKSVFASESEALSSSLNTAMSNMLYYAKYVSKDASGRVVFTSQENGVNNGCFFLKNDRLCYVTSGDNALDPNYQKMLINGGAYTSLYLKSFSLTFTPDSGSSDRGVFSASYVIGSRALTGAEKTIQCKFRSLTGELSGS
jgi:prepilin-type N-terminal cleavage/methylation domain-containing protein